MVLFQKAEAATTETEELLIAHMHCTHTNKHEYLNILNITNI